MDKVAQMLGKIACFLFLVAIFIIGKYIDENKTKYSSNLNSVADSVNIADSKPAVRVLEKIGNYNLTTSTTGVNLRNLGPFHFLPNHKNPCWRRIESNKTLTRCIPYFYLIGCEKCGSSDLWYRLLQHPEIAATDKETLHWINKNRFHGLPFEFYLDWFQAAVEDFYEECRRTHTDRYCVNTKKPEQSRIGQIWKGIYYIHFGEFYRVFPKEQILVLKLDDCKINYDECLNRTFKFLGISPVTEEFYKALNTNYTVKNTRQYPARMWNSTKRMLEEFYKPYNDELVKMLGPHFNFSTKYSP
ncbi:CHSTF-like protein [Mya arenaria]|uniref:CHSTF-like protein n=1 Tax=Mya arenaria TaxID=6604 RepID=A0ABY7FZZ4_MYAAR|nr:CHSTF-like protein [Mya arenaria]